MQKANHSTREIFLQYSRPLFRTCEIICNHAARIFLKKSSLSNAKVISILNDLNAKRIDFQRQLNEIGNSHSHVCADCKGKCCGGVRERDAFIDRIIQYQETPHLKTRRKTGEMAAYNVLAAKGTPITDTECVPGFCTELTTKGCKIPYELRPIQCTAYFCRKTVDELSQKECEIGIRALTGLMKIQVQTVALALKSRLYLR